ncbi:hypothetical protein [Pseudomonas lactis]|uniref:hypothetical protein n=1 Tax=Pseudomonas lactis TaxID=1615674 RepID=UPI000AB1CBC3|nr:hypothetical protein [Pseudomonas lactis]
MDYMASQMDRQIEDSQVAYAAAMEDGRQPAFPVADYDHQTFNPATVDEAKRQLSGMSLRDYFAAKAMQGWTANPLPNDSSIQEVAEWAYRQADAMLAARSA